MNIKLILFKTFLLSGAFGFLYMGIQDNTPISLIMVIIVLLAYHWTEEEMK